MFEQNIYQMVDQNNGKEIKQVLDTENNKVIWERAIPTYDTPIVPTRNAPLLEVSVDGVCRTVDSSLPDGYVELESVVFDGSSYFDTGIVITSFDYEIESDAVFPNDSSTPIAVWGFMDSSNNNLPRWMTGIYNSNWLTSINNSLPIGTYDSDRHKIKNTLYINNNTPNWTTFIDGTEVKASTTVIAHTSLIESNTLSIYIGARNNSGKAGNFFNGTFYGIKIVKDSVLIRNYVALKRLSDNVIVLYDKVNNVILQNLGEGTLTAGNLVHQTPTNSFDIYCNNGAVKYGALGANLLNPAGITIGQYYTPEGNYNESQNNWRTGLIQIEGGKTYAFWGRRKSDNKISAFNRINWFDIDGNNISPRPNYTTNTVTVGTSPSNAAFVGLSCSCYNSSDAITQATFDEFNWMFAETDTEIPYEPFVGGIYAHGTPEVLTVGGKNLIDPTTRTKPSPNMYRWYNATGFLLKANTAYTFSARSADKTLNVYFYDFETSTSIKSGSTGAVTYTPTEDKRVFFAAYIANGIPEDTISQLEYGDTATTYEPYVTPQTTSVPNLFAVDNYADKVEIISGLVPRKVGVKVLDGTEEWTYLNDAIYANIVPVGIPYASRGGMCTHFTFGSGRVIADMADGEFIYNCASGTSASNGNLSLKSSLFSDLATATAWLAEQYAAGTPVIILYPLLEETTESITPHTLQGYKGKTMSVAVQSDYVTGQNVKVKYLGIDNTLVLDDDTQVETGQG